MSGKARGAGCIRAPASAQSLGVQVNTLGGQQPTKDPQTPCLGSFTPMKVEPLQPEKMAPKDGNNVQDVTVPDEGVVSDLMALRKDVMSLKRDASSITADLGLLFQQV